MTYSEEDRLFEAHGFKRGGNYPRIPPRASPPFRDAKLRHPCPGDGVRGCLVRIPLSRARCRFCWKTLVLRDAARRE